MLLEAVFGPLLVWLVLAEFPGGWTLAGGAVVLGALTLNNLAGLRERR
jgi:drug/metabolite transporter (DMT)-like permease